MKRSEFHETWFFHFKLFYFRFFVSVKKWPNTKTEERERFPVKRKSIRLHRKKVFFGTDEKHFFPIVFFAFWSSHRHKSIFFIFHHGPKNFFCVTRSWYPILIRDVLPKLLFRYAFSFILVFFFLGSWDVIRWYLSMFNIYRPTASVPLNCPKIEDSITN